MNENKGKTIKQIAEIFGVSKTAVRKYMTDDFRKKYVQTDGNGVLYINQEGENQLKSLWKLPRTTENQFAETTENEVCGTETLLKQMIDILQQQLKEKDNQIKELQTQAAQLTSALENTTNSLKAAQALHAATVKQIAEQETEVPATAADGEIKTKHHWWQLKKNKV